MRWQIGVALVMILLAACSAADETKTGNAATPATPAIGEWRSVANFPFDGPRVTVAYGGEYRVETRDVSENLGDKPTETRVVNTEGVEVLTHMTPGRGWFAQDVWVTNDYLVVEEINERRRKLRFVAYDLSTRRRLPLPAPPISEPEMDASGGVVAYISGRPQSPMCVQLLDLASFRVREAACGLPGEVLADVAYNAGRVVYSVIQRPNQKDRCKTVWVASLVEKPRALPTQQQCLGWSGAVVADAVAWDEADPLSEQLAVSRDYVQSADGRVREIGSDIDTDSIVGCGGRFFWNTSDGERSRINTMGIDADATAFWVGGPDEYSTLLRCIDDRWLQMSVDVLNGENPPTEYLVRDLRPQA